jgi:hypothetical protein
VLPGQFLIKDIVLVSAALWTLGDSLGGASRPFVRARAATGKVSAGNQA